MPGVERAVSKSLSIAQAKLSAYNTLLSQAGDAQNALRAAEKELRPFSARMLTGVATKYGKDSSQYEKAGGTRKSEIKRPARKPVVIVANPTGGPK